MKIVLEMNGTEFTLTMEEAKEIWKELDEIFSKSKINVHESPIYRSRDKVLPYFEDPTCNKGL